MNIATKNISMKNGGERERERERGAKDNLHPSTS
jgi:hypothetical protein